MKKKIQLWKRINQKNYIPNQELKKPQQKQRLEKLIGALYFYAIQIKIKQIQMLQLNLPTFQEPTKYYLTQKVEKCMMKQVNMMKKTKAK